MKRLDYLFRLQALGLGLVTLVVGGAAAGYASANHAVQRALEVREHVGRWLTGVLEVQATAHAYLASGRDSSLDAYRRAMAAGQGQADAVHTVLADGPAQQANWRAADEHARAALAAWAGLVESIASGPEQAAMRTGQGGDGEGMARFREDLRRIRAVEDEMLDQRRRTAARRGIFAGVAALGLALSSGVLLVFTSRLRRTREATLALAIENARALRETEAAHAEERRLRGQSEAASHAKDEFLAVVSHELRTPLNAILGWTVTLRRRKPTPDLDRGLSVIERNARAQAKLIEDVLDVSRIISGKLPLNLAPTNIADAVAAAVETVSPAAEAKSIRLSVDLPDPTLVITADAHRVQQIIWNLLANAMKFTPKGGCVEVRAYREGSEVRVTVKDSGEGIRREVLPLIFEPFQQADVSTTRRHGGLGLGLAIVKQLVSAHGGTVCARSEGQGKGALFLVRLPARSPVPAVAKAPLPSAQAEHGEPLPPPPPTPRLDGVRLLVVDDERDALMLVGEVLREQGAEVHLAGSAAEALGRLPVLLPHVLVSDIGMPETDGYILIRKVRELAPALGGNTPAIALTAYARREDAERAVAAGFQRFVAKPVEPDELVLVVASLSGRAPTS